MPGTWAENESPDFEILMRNAGPSSMLLRKRMDMAFLLK